MAVGIGFRLRRCCALLDIECCPLTQSSEATLRATTDRNLAEEWELVLIAQGFSPSLSRSGESFVLSVPEWEAERALAGLAAYERENPREAGEKDAPAGPPNLLAGAGAGGILLLFYFATEIWFAAAGWIERGSADADRILRGELWRAVTALTLHANLGHALSNVFGIAIFLGLVSSILGPGLASVLALLAGAGGNLANALLHGSAHVSIGASTAVFGAVGMLGGLAVARSGPRKAPRRRRWAPVAAAVALLAMLGTGGERVDVLAHFFGFLFGGVLGVLFAFVAPYPPGRLLQWGCGSATLALLIYCWMVALG
ncbi:MAG: rhomboid family intramembrane serine protease [Candidatus Binatia bacterium]